MHGPCRYFHYREWRHSVRFDWEFGGAPDIVVIIFGQKPEEWDRKYP